MYVRASFTRRELAHLVDALDLLKEVESHRRDHCKLTDENIDKLRFKIWRILLGKADGLEE